MFDRVEHQPRLVAFDVAFIDEQPLGDLAVMRDAARKEDHQVIPLASECVALLHFRRSAHARAECRMQAESVALHRDPDRRERRRGQQIDVEHRHLAHQAGFAITDHASLHSACRQSHRFAKFGQRRRRIALQQIKQLVVELVEDGNLGHAIFLRQAARFFNRDAFHSATLLDVDTGLDDLPSNRTSTPPEPGVHA